MDPDEELRSRLAWTPPGLPSFAPRLDDVLARVRHRRRRRRRRVGTFAASVALLLGVGLPLSSLTGLHHAPRRPATVPVQNGKIAYTLFRGGDENIYSINPDGSGKTRLTGQGGLDSDPVWSPDGTQIAFMSFRPPVEGQPPAVYLMNADGTDLRRLVPNAFGPSWSPDGTKVAFSRAGNTDIYVVNVDGSGLTRLTDDPARDVSPTWSPDGRRLAFEEGSGRFGSGALYVMNADGSGLHEVLGDRIVGEPHWSPNGDEIVFESPRGPNPDGPTDIYTVNADGSGLTGLTDDTARELSPTWSPDGTKIAFSSDRDGRRQIFVMNADGSEVTKVTSDSSAAAFPSWGTQPTTSIAPTPAVVSSLRRPIHLFRGRTNDHFWNLYAVRHHQRWRITLVGSDGSVLFSKAGSLNARTPALFGWKTWDDAGRLVTLVFGIGTFAVRGLQVHVGTTHRFLTEDFHPRRLPSRYRFFLQDFYGDVVSIVSTRTT